MPTQRRDAPIRIFDVMALVGASALGFWIWRVFDALSAMSDPALGGSLLSWYFQALGLSGPLATLSLALLPIALRTPRRRPRRALTEPAGFLGVAVLVTLLLNASTLAAVMALTGNLSYGDFAGGKVFYLARCLVEQVGAAALIAGVIAVVAGRSPRKMRPIDLLAVALGVGWTMLALGSIAFTFY